MVDNIKQDQEKIEAMLNGTTPSELLRRLTGLLQLVNHIDSTYTEKNPNYVQHLSSYNHPDKRFITTFSENINKLSSLSKFPIARIVEEKRSFTPK